MRRSSKPAEWTNWDAQQTSGKKWNGEIGDIPDQLLLRSKPKRNKLTHKNR